MATIFWAPSSGTAPVSPTPSATDWDGHVNSVSRSLNLARANTALTSLAYAPDAADHLTDVATMIAQFVSAILPPQTIAVQQIAFGARTLESNALNNLMIAFKLYAVDVPGTSVLGTIVPVFKGTTEFGTALSGRGQVRAGSALTLNVPWRLVLEVGADGLPTTGGGRHNFTVEFGDPLATGLLSLIQDGDTGAGPPILIFSNDLKLLPLCEAVYAAGLG